MKAVDSTGVIQRGNVDLLSFDEVEVGAHDTREWTEDDGVSRDEVEEDLGACEKEQEVSAEARGDRRIAEVSQKDALDKILKGAIAQPPSIAVIICPRRMLMYLGKSVARSLAAEIELAETLQELGEVKVSSAACLWMGDVKPTSVRDTRPKKRRRRRLESPKARQCRGVTKGRHRC